MADTARFESQYPTDPGRARRPGSSTSFWILLFGSFLGFGIWNLGFSAPPPSSDDIPPLRPPRDLIPPTYWEQHSTAIILVVLIVLVLLLVLVLVLLRPKRPVFVPPELQARQALEQLRRKTEDGLVLSRVSQILRRYFAAAFQLSPDEMTTTEFCATITANARIGPELSIPLVEFLRACDERKFSPAPAASITGSVVEQALKFIWLGHARLKEVQHPSPITHHGSSIPRLNDQ
jgi:hypothetical protein